MQKVDIYSVGIIFFEMCHPPAATAMERHKMLVEIRKKEIVFPQTFDKEKQTQVGLCEHEYHYSMQQTRLLLVHS